MPKPNNPNTTAATAAVVRRGQETMARKLRAAKWTVIPPVDLAALTRRLGLPDHEQSAVASFTGDPCGTVWTEAEAAELIRVWRQTDPRRDLPRRELDTLPRGARRMKIEHAPDRNEIAHDGVYREGS